MRRITSHRPSPAMVVAFIALLFALGGGAYAQLRIPRNSVGTPQLKRAAVTSAKVKNRSLLARDFRAGQLPAGPRGVEGPVGPAGPAGERGPVGPQGAAGATNVTVRDDFGTGSASVLCAPSEKATGGGGTVEPPQAGSLIASEPEISPTGTPDGWFAESSDGGDTVIAWVICAAP